MPLLVLDETNRVRFANAAAEDFFQAGKATLLRARFADLDAAVEPGARRRRRGPPLRRHRQRICDQRRHAALRRRAQRRSPGDACMHERSPRFVIVMLLERSMAHKIDRQLTHRGAARSVSGLASMLAHEIKNPLAGIAAPRN